jgi:crotonobetainyl-CoA:carnitine CoA-transferase CaiB-like acyl-CoA transferase
VVQTVSGMTIRQAESIPGKTPEPQFYPVSAIDYCTGYLMAFGAMVALARRTREGGSWLVRISLAQVGKWIVISAKCRLPRLRIYLLSSPLANWNVGRR